MRKIGILGVVGVLAVILAGCGGGSSGPDLVGRDILSMGGADDGDITYDPVLPTYTVVTNEVSDNVFIGTFPNPLDPTNPLSDTDSRGFLTFSLAQIPAGASIQNAQILVRINDVFVDTGPSVVILPALVSFNPLNTLTTFETSNLYQDAEILVSTVSYNVFPADIGSDIFIDAADALILARQSGFPTLQIKLTGSFGRIIVDDIQFPPILRVDYIF